MPVGGGHNNDPGKGIACVDGAAGTADVIKESREVGDLAYNGEAEAALVAAVMHGNDMLWRDKPDYLRSLSGADGEESAYGHKGPVESFELFELVGGRHAAQVAEVGEPYAAGVDNMDPVRAAQGALFIVMEGVDDIDLKAASGGSGGVDAAPPVVVAVLVAAKDKVRLFPHRVKARNGAVFIRVEYNGAARVLDFKAGMPDPCNFH